MATATPIRDPAATVPKATISRTTPTPSGRVTIPSASRAARPVPRAPTPPPIYAPVAITSSAAFVQDCSAFARSLWAFSMIDGVSVTPVEVKLDRFWRLTATEIVAVDKLSVATVLATYVGFPQITTPVLVDPHSCITRTKDPWAGAETTVLERVKTPPREKSDYSSRESESNVSHENLPRPRVSRVRAKPRACREACQR